jgi:hypothetical protein
MFDIQFGAGAANALRLRLHQNYAAPCISGSSSGSVYAIDTDLLIFFGTYK